MRRSCPRQCRANSPLHSWIVRSGSGLVRYSVLRPSRRASTRPTSSSTCRCFDADGWSSSSAVGDLGDRSLLAREQLEDVPPARLSDGVEGIGARRCPWHACGYTFPYGNVSRAVAEVRRSGNGSTPEPCWRRLRSPCVAVSGLLLRLRGGALDGALLAAGDQAGRLPLVGQCATAETKLPWLPGGARLIDTIVSAIVQPAPKPRVRHAGVDAADDDRRPPIRVARCSPRRRRTPSPSASGNVQPMSLQQLERQVERRLHVVRQVRVDRRLHQQVARRDGVVVRDRRSADDRERRVDAGAVRARRRRRGSVGSTPMSADDAAVELPAIARPVGAAAR